VLIGREGLSRDFPLLIEEVGRMDDFEDVADGGLLKPEMVM
jgi:hypothetical protein